MDADAINNIKIKTELIKELNNALKNGQNYTDYLNKLIKIYKCEVSQKDIKSVSATSYLLILLISQNYIEVLNNCKFFNVRLFKLNYINFLIRKILSKIF